MNSLIDWDSPTFGAAGSNVHESSVASWLGDGTHDDGPVD